MSTKQDVEKWREGCALASKEDFATAEEIFLDMSDITARIYFNLASCALKQGKMYRVGAYLDKAVEKDPYMAVGFYQRGCFYLHQKKYNEALQSFESAFKQLRGNLVIDYKQLGLIYKLYSVEVLLNMSYALVQIGRKSEALEKLDEANQGSRETGEQRHQIVKTAYDAARVGGSFKPFKLPNSAMFYKPPQTKVDNLEKKNFLGTSKVVASITDNDDYTGFIGAQNLPRSRSPSPNRRLSPTPTSDKKRVLQKPSGPLPVPPKERIGSSSSYNKPTSPLPPKPNLKPPSIRSVGTSSPSISPEEEEEIFVKVHYTSTRALVVDRHITLKDLEELVCRKFERPIESISLWYKVNDELSELTNELSLKKAISSALDGDRLTIWAYDKESTDSPEGGEVEAIYDHDAQQSGDLPFKKGDRIRIVKELDPEWYVGSMGGQSGIFPKSYVKNIY